MSTHVIIHRRISILATLLVAWLIAGLSPSRLNAQATQERTVRPLANDFTTKAIRRLIAGNGYAAHSFGFRPFVRPAITADNWLGGSGNWNAAASWSLGTVPGSGNDASITTSSSTVQLNVAGAINNLTIGSTDVLNFNNDNTLTIGGSTITNSNTAGGITMSSVGNNTDLIIGSSAVTLTGGGTITMSNNVNNRIYGAVAADVLTNANNTIQGSGQIGADQMGFVNQSAGVVDANQSNSLTIWTSNGTTNQGTLEATAGANLILKNDTFTNTGGTILASGTSSVVTLLNSTIAGGTLNTASGGLIQASGNPTLNGVTVASTGTYQLPNDNDTTIMGTITNKGTIQQNSVGNNTDLILGGASVTLTGSGTITMDNNVNNRIYGAAGADVLTNVNNTIQGSGQIGADQLALVNESAGIIDANQPNTLTINTSNGTTNTGTMEATAGGTLVFAGSDTYTNTSGTILASGTNSTVELTGTVTIVGGTLNTASGGLIEDTSGTPTLSGVTNKGTYNVLNNEQTQLLGTLTNQGTINLNSNGNATELQANGNVTLTGGGTIVMSDNVNNYLLQSVSGSSMTNVNNTISGSGNIGNGAMAFTNDAGGIVDALSTAGNKLTIQTGAATATNLGLMEAGSGGNLVLDGTIVNTGGTLEALNGGVVTLNGSIITGGTLTTAGTGVVTVSGTAELNGATNTVTNAGTLQIPNNQVLEFTGTLNNTGAISLNSVGNDTELLVNSAAATLSGAGSVTFSDNPNNYILATTGGDTLTLAQPVSGPGGNIGNGELVITNQSTIDATASAHGNSLTIEPDATFTNHGTLEATGGGVLVLDGGTFTNTGATITAGSGSTVDLNGSVDIVGGTLNGAGTFVGNSGAQLDGSGAHPVSVASILQIPNNAAFYIDGTIKNTGTLELLSGGNTTELVVNSAAATLQGAGSVTFSDNNDNYILAAAGGNQLTIAQPISGPGGNIGNGSVVLVNQSTIDATASAHGNTLKIDPDGTMSNTGLLEATGGGSLALDGGTFTNTGSGAITAGSGSNVTFEGSVTVTGGTLNGAGLFTSNSGTTLNGLTNASTVVVPNNTQTTLQGTITNTGAIQENSVGNNTFLDPTGAVTLTSGGTVTLSDNNDNYIEAAVGGSTLTNVNNTISGSGNIGNSGMGFTNQSAGVVDATSSAGHSLTINSGTIGATNTGLFEASSGGELILNGTVTNTSGTIEGLAGTGSNAGGSVLITGATVTGGTLNTLGTGVNASSMTAENSTLSGLTNLGNIVEPNNQSLDLMGTIANNGSINVNSTGNNTFLYMNGNVTLDGNGTLVLSNNPNNYVRGVAGTEVLTNNGNTIEGAGQLGSGILGFVNNVGGTILANQPNALVIQPNASGITNSGTLEVNTGSLMNIVGSGALTNFNSSNSTLTGGTYNINGGELEFVGANIINNAADIIMTGAGEIVNSTNSGNALLDFAVNEAGGVFQLGSGFNFTTVAGFTNNGRLVVGAGDTFKVVNGDLTNFASSTLTGGTYFDAGTLQFGASGTHITTNDANITLSTAGWSMINLGGGNLLTNLATNDSGASFTVANNASFTTAGAFSNSGTMDVENGGTLEVAGALTNNGTVSTNGTNQGGAANTLTVTGTLTNGASDTVAIGENNDTTDVASIGILTNSGTVTVGTGATLNLTSAGTDTNTGTITDKGTLSLATTADLDMETGGKLAVTGPLTNAGAITTNEANLGGPANTVTVSGKVTNDSGASITIGANNDTADTGTFGTLANSGTVTVGTGATLTLSGAATNTNPGTLAVDGTLNSKGSITLTGTGKLTLSAGTVADTGTNKTLTVGAHNTVSGSGTISGFGVTNAGTLSATSGTLAFLPDSAGLTNNGTIKVSSGATMQIGTSAGGAFTNLSGTTLTGGIYSLTGTLEFGSSGTTIATNAANITLTGAGEMKDFGGNNILAGFNNNSSTGVFKLATGASLLTSGGSFTNAGTFTISTGTTFTIGGSSFDYTQTGGSTTVAGTLTSTSLGTVNLDAGTLTGAGTIGDNVVDDSTLDPGTSAAKTGRLTVTDTYTQDAGGSLNMEINGAAAVTKYDQLKVTGDATLGGTLNIDLGSGFTPTVGEKFTIVTASAVADQFATVNGLAINGTEHFTITYNAGSVVLTVVSGPLPSASPSLITAAVHPTLYGGAVIGRGSAGGHYGLALNTLRMARTPVTGTVAASQSASLAPAFRLAHVPAANSTLRPVTMPVSQISAGIGMRGFHAMDDFGSPVAAPSSAVDAGVSSGIGVSSLGAEAYNPMGAMNHMRFELGVDMKALFKTSRKQLVRALWASPDSPEALSIGYMTFTGSH